MIRPAESSESDPTSVVARQGPGATISDALESPNPSPHTSKDLDTTKPTQPAKPVVSRRQFFKRLAIGGAALASLGSYARWVEPFWPEFHELPMPIAGLPTEFEGFRITHLTDTHFGNIVPEEYLVSVGERVNTLKPDLVVHTGDLVMQNDPWITGAVAILAKLKPPTIVSFGNHDYGYYGRALRGTTTSTAEALTQSLTAAGRTVLRNRATALTRGDARLWFVGLEDLFSGLFNVETAFRDRSAGEPTIVLSHNPDTIAMLLPRQPDWILCGHTHGGQVRLPFLGAPLLPVNHREWDQGLFAFPPEKPVTRAYVSRAVGYVKQVRFWCRPEVPTFTLTHANS